MRHRSWFSVAVLVLVLTCLSNPRSAHAGTSPRIRSIETAVAEVIGRGYAVSSTFRELMNRIERSDVIVHVLWQQSGTSRRGAMHFVTRAGGNRYIRITMYGRMLMDEAVALLGHELQHAREIADSAWVTDESTLRALYRTIGHPSCPERRCFDTHEASAAGHRVLSEMRSAE
jgi:hypothetical protein